MTVLPESPVRKYAERVEARIAFEINEPHRIPRPLMNAPAGVIWQRGVRDGLAQAHGIVASEEPAPGTETTYFEYRAIGADDEEVTTEREHWVASFDAARAQRQDLANLEPPFAHLYIERRTVTVTQPVRLGDGGEPTS